MIAAILGAVFFGLAAYVGQLLGTTVAERMPRVQYGPLHESVPSLWLLGVSAAIGAFVATHAVEPAQIALIAIVMTALAAVWCTDSITGMVPDVFTLGPLAIVLLVAIWQHEWWLFVSASVPFVPFAVAAALSHGRAMGWGDVKLVALGGAVLGAQISLVAFAVACLAAFAVSYARGRRSGAIAFAPYLAAAIALAIPIGIIR